MFFDSNNKAECTACTACINSCPKQCINLVTDDEGFVFPQIDNDKCINCGLCRKVCPVEHPNYDNSEAPQVYAALLKDKKQIVRSTSGGLFYAIASWIIGQGGIVFGAALDDNNKVRHIGAESIEGLEKLRGSKYVQSDLSDVFRQIKEYLKLNRWCYFVGTGCQVAGLKSFLINEYDTLLTSDVVCHGVPSQRLFDKHIQYLSNKYNGKIINYQFRDNIKWGGCESFKVIRNNSSSISKKTPTYYLTPYLYSFMHGMTFRYSCYDCKFARIPRQGDITLADYWGVRDLFPKIDASHGVSLILLNNTKGSDLWNRIKEKCDFYESNVQDSSRKNGNLVIVSHMPDIRNKIFKEIERKGYDEVAETLFRTTHPFRIKMFYFLENTPVVSKVFEQIVKIYHGYKKN